MLGLALVFLTFFQLLTDFIAAIYAFGLLGTSLPPELVAVAFLFSPLLLLPFRRQVPRPLLPGALAVALAARAVEPFLPIRGTMLVAGLGTAALMLALPLLLLRARPREVLAGLGWAVAAAAGLRALGAGYDLSTQGGVPLLGVGLVLLAAAALWRRPLPEPGAGGPAHPREGIPWGIALGLTSIWILLYFAFVAPNVIARWTGTSPQAILPLFALSLTAWGAYGALRPLPRPGTLLAWTLLLVLGLTLTLRAYQIPFPPDPGAYPLPEPPAPAWAGPALGLLLATFPVLLFDFAALGRALAARRPRPPALGLAFGLGALYALALILAHVFTTTYDYIPVVGPFFRDRFWAVHLVPGLVLLFALVRTRGPEGPTPALGRAFLGGLVLLGLGIGVGAWARAPRPGPPPEAPTTLRVLTYNVQQGYREDGQPGHADQLALMRELAPDLIGLQESEGNRIANGNADLVGYLAANLGMYAYPGPKVVPGTFGIALLSRYPLENPRTFYLYSEGEQTAALHAQITVKGRRFHVFVTHLGNGGPIVQQENVLAEVDGLENVILMGDFNFRPDTPQYRLTVQTLVDAWRLRWPDGVDDRGVRPSKRIDHVFLSPGLRVQDVRYLFSPASDHPALLAVLEVGP